MDRISRSVPQPMHPGTRVEVYGTFLAAWVRGFEVATRHDARYRLRRVSDGVVLLAEFANHDVRRQRH